MTLFSERYGYTKPSDVIIRERITPEIQNAIFNCIIKLEKSLTFNELGYIKNYFTIIERDICEYHLNQKIIDYKPGYIIDLIDDSSIEWYKKLDLLELIIKTLVKYCNMPPISEKIIKDYIENINFEFERLKFSYRVINNQIVEITSEEEIKSIETALTTGDGNIREHLNRALELYSKRPVADYRNSIKESISAVEVFCREKTGEDTLGKALNKLESNGIVIHKLLKSAFDKLYAYTNQPDTGARHALMDNDGAYVPQAEEALFMLVSCSAFINYLNKKIK
jgi:hypothetical protein